MHIDEPWQQVTARQIYHPVSRRRRLVIAERGHPAVLHDHPSTPRHTTRTCPDRCFYDRVERDDLLSPFFPGGVSAEHREHVTTWWCEVLGGPAGYTERLGGYPAMLAHHRDLGITAEQRFRFASLMSLAADDARLPDDPEFRAALVGYLEWGTRLAMHNSQPGAVVVQQAPVPHWGWGVAPPYQP